MFKYLKSFRWTIVSLLIALCTVGAIVYADNVQNDVTVGVGGNKEATITVGGSVIVKYRIQDVPNDGGPRCNASDGSSATVTINLPTGVSASTNPLIFSACDTPVATTFTSTTPGNYVITITVSDAGSGSYNPNPAAFTLHVLAPTDTTSPDITPSITGTLGNNGWYISDVTVTWTVSDAQSTVTSMTGCDSTTISTDTAGTTLTCTATSAGGTSSQSVTIKRDATAPTISGEPTSDANANDWYNGDVTVTFTCTDELSGIDTCPDDHTFNTDGEDQSVTGTATDLAGNSASFTVGHINIDMTAPTISGAPTSDANGNSWYNTDVTIHFECSDELSDIDACSPDQLISTEGENLSTTGFALDKAGNIASTIVGEINIDKTAPTIEGSRLPAANGNGWNNTDVVVSFLCDDGLSGVATCVGNTTISAETAGQSVTGTATDKAGNSATATVSDIKIDKTAPTISGTASPAPNAAGWNNTNVNVTFSCADALSLIATCGPNQTLSSEGNTLSATGTAVDNADNTASATVSGINIDKTAPVVTVTGPANNASYPLGSVPTAGCSTTDSLSGVATNATLSVTGGNSVGIGTFTATCSGAVDNAGNATPSVSVTYNVIYRFAGFFSPVDNPPVVNSVRAGSAIPIKFSLGGNYGLNILDIDSPSTMSISCATFTTNDDVEQTVTAGSSSLSYDAATGQYTYVWKTDRSWSGCRQFVLRLNDGTVHYAIFNFRR